jgi:chlorobactene glucosyltransferase
VLPARNEAHNIERCVRSLCASRYPRLEIIVVDDRSGDGTGGLARRAAAGDPRVRVLDGAELPAGWFGKAWACWQGFRAAGGALLLFTDADTVHGPDLHARAVAVMQREGADLVTVMPHQELVSFWERAVQPFFFLFLGLRFGTLERVNRGRRPRDAIANGQFILVTRASYEQVGGHEAVRDTVVEDLMLAVAYRTAGRRHFLALGEDLSVRMYTSLRGIVEGWTKNLFSGAVQSLGHRGLATLAMLAALNVPLAFLVPAAALVAGPLAGSAALTLFGALACTGCTLILGRMLYAARAPAWYALCHPLGAAVMAYIMVRGTVRGTRRIEWKGRTYSHAQRTA